MAQCGTLGLIIVYRFFSGEKIVSNVKTVSNVSLFNSIFKDYRLRQKFAGVENANSDIFRSSPLC